jgi:hypothetical protein
MSGGSFNYIYGYMKDELCGYMEDDIMNEIIKDIVEIVHDLEWWKSSDIAEEDYRKTVKKFKEKWLRPSSEREEAMKQIIKKSLEKMEEI